MASYSAHDESVFVVDFTPDQAMAEGAVVFRRRDFRLQVGWRIEAGMRQIEFGEDLTLAELVQRLSS